jgi:sulfotransferase family protein
MRVLVVGLPRSGTTWISHALALAPGVHFVHEPDAKEHHPFAYVGTRHLDALPELAPGQHLREYELLWKMAFGAGWPAGRISGLVERVSFDPRVPVAMRIGLQECLARIAVRRPAVGEHQLVKTVRSFLAAEWIASQADARVVVIWRNPLNTISSWQRLGWGSGTLRNTDAAKRFVGTGVWPPPEDPFADTAWGVCAALTLLLESALRNPDWTVVKHETVCADASTELRRLFDALGLSWSEAIDSMLDAADTPGSGWELNRVRAGERAVWADRMSPAEQRTALETVAGFAAESDPYGAFSEALSHADAELKHA